MKMRWLLTLLLALVALALGLFVYFMPGEDARNGFAISALTAQQIKHIRVERAGESPIVLERAGNGWRMTEPLRAAADPAEASRLLAVLGARAPQGMAPVELARFELDKPPLRLVFDGQSLDFGMVSAVAREQYVLAGGAVYVIEPKYTVHIPRETIGFVSRRLLAEDARIAGLQLPAFTVEQQAGAWLLSPPAAETSADDLSRFVEAWRHASAQRVERAGAGMPQENVTVRLTNGETLQFGIVRRENETVMRSAANGLDYIFPADAARQLLSRPGTTKGP